MDRFPGERPRIGTLDGMDFMTVGTYTWPNENNPIHLRSDYDAIRWLEENVPGTPVLAEVPIGYYREFGGRVCSYTGLPAMYNEQHEREQRYDWQNAQRSSRAHTFFSTENVEQTLDIARDLHVEYVYIGPLERTQYPQVEAKFAQMANRGLIAIAYQNEQVTIYRID
jgi:uncharacterized membrane protein